MGIILTFIVIGIVAMAHELGHYYVARRQKIRVKELSIGVGPVIYQKKGKETVYSLRLIPVFAYVNLAGSTPEEENMSDGFLNKRPGQKAKVLAAGSFMNIVLAIIIFIILFMGVGTYSNKPIVGNVTQGLPAQEAGMQGGDRILTIDGIKIDEWQDVTERIQASQDKKMEVTVERDGKEILLEMTPTLSKETKSPIIGITASTERLNPLEAIYRGFEVSIQSLFLMISGLIYMIIGKQPMELSGPVGIVNMVGEAANAGLISLMSFTAILSLNLAILNLLPIPGLDGGKLLIVLVEKVRGKRLPLKTEVVINLIGFLLLILMMIFVTYKDIVKIISGQ